jgi:hypothetical protein
MPDEGKVATAKFVAFFHLLVNFVFVASYAITTLVQVT